MCDEKLPTLVLTEDTRMTQLEGFLLSIFLVKYNVYTIGSGTNTVSRHNPKVGCFRVRSHWTSVGMVFLQWKRLAPGQGKVR